MEWRGYGVEGIWSGGDMEWRGYGVEGKEETRHHHHRRHTLPHIFGFVFKGLGFTFCYEFWTEFV